MVEFFEMPKIPQWNRQVIVTEKIDGTNAGVLIQEDGTVQACSKNRILTPEADNFGFCKWVNEHAEELKQLGPGLHRGEWWGCGIQRRYGLSEKRFSLFNTSRWHDANFLSVPLKASIPCPKCCNVVPTLGVLESPDDVNRFISELVTLGSKAAPGFMDPEGIVIYHTASGELFKATCKNDESPKSRI